MKLEEGATAKDRNIQIDVYNTQGGTIWLQKRNILIL